MKAYLESSEYIDWEHPLVLDQAMQLSEGDLEEEKIVKSCFEFVRDEIKHSWDFQQRPVTCSASSVLTYKTGYCYAKSHLLAALLRANDIPAGLCYQRLVVEEEAPPYCLHGLNAVYLEKHGWYRLDPRGNKLGVIAEFCPPNEQLAFALTDRLERDFPEVWTEPLPAVIEVLTKSKNIKEVYENLPDIEVY